MNLLLVFQVSHQGLETKESHGYGNYLGPNYAFKRTAELALGSNQVFAPQPLNAALEI